MRIVEITESSQSTTPDAAHALNTFLFHTGEHGEKQSGTVTCPWYRRLWN